ncbi:PREDICTED: translocator protein [Myotis davidii]|uniref:translocator protein n=1 Tax=Myotis davidii TaxID=225400 RepID=UPI000767168B|nr:PREDICTED: translocator protein [Myotis davidii]
MAPPWVPAVGFTLAPSLGGFLAGRASSLARAPAPGGAVTVGAPWAAAPFLGLLCQGRVEKVADRGLQHRTFPAGPLGRGGPMAQPHTGILAAFTTPGLPRQGWEPHGFLLHSPDNDNNAVSGRAGLTSLCPPGGQCAPGLFSGVALTGVLCFRYGSYLVWRELGGFSEEAVVPLGLYAGQLTLNWAWPPIFFGSRQMGVALVDLLLTGGLVAATAVAWHRVSPPAARLLYPYLAWLAFATALNYCSDVTPNYEELGELSRQPPALQPHLYTRCDSLSNKLGSEAPRALRR